MPATTLHRLNAMFATALAAVTAYLDDGDAGGLVRASAVLADATETLSEMVTAGTAPPRPTLVDVAMASQETGRHAPARGLMLGIRQRLTAWGFDTQVRCSMAAGTAAHEAFERAHMTDAPAVTTEAGVKTGDGGATGDAKPTTGTLL